ncbi:1-aminocyclopropane-1-carboxylate deaminase/D-cysteine desulfhydrase [Aquimarina pacifica]|uniref:1-aminocyclopropane-1-carboxylate deaminase/D-cysteine desulfhydrase n=1 Tax=Aquimarina pacifica TaxID=1296415 RepID=UPI00046EE040|nr:pyridoxal-phosphate dependent enzyme [Aquimarina pacifica]
MFFSSFNNDRSKNEEILHPVLEKAGVSLSIKREDQLHEYVSGNKFRKLKYNFIEAKRLGYTTLLTFGGAYSNHIEATAAAGKIMGFQTIGVIRGDELAKNLENTLSNNETLYRASEAGMQFEFVSRAHYRDKMNPDFLETLRTELGAFYIIPEGGTNLLAVKGCAEILNPKDSDFDVLCCAVGTGGTIAGIINSTTSNQKVLGFPALKGDFLSAEIKKYTSKTNWQLSNEYHFGGYGKINKEGIAFINTFYDQQQILLDPIYTGKMMYGIFDMIEKGMFSKNTRILAIHTGGIQGIAGMNKKLKKKKLPLITAGYSK